MPNTESSSTPVFELTTSRQFLSWMAEQKLSLALTTYQIGKLFLLGLKENGQLVKIEQIKNKVPYGDRSNTIIEPLLTEQWFVDAKHLSKKPIEVVKKRKTTFYPENWKKTFFQFRNHLQLTRVSQRMRGHL